MSNSIEKAWYVIKHTVKSLCCCHNVVIGDQRFTGSSTQQIGHQNVGYLTTDENSDETVTPIDDRKTKFRLKWKFNSNKLPKDNVMDITDSFADVEEELEKKADVEGDLRNKSSFSTTRESGYGRSIEEDNVEIPLVVTVSEIRAKMVSD